MADTSNVIDVALVPEGQAAQRDNMNVCCVMTSEQGNVLSTVNRYESYEDSAAVATDLGTDSDIYQHALAFFAQSPNPIQVGGKFIVGFYRAAEETVAATAAILLGAQLTEATAVSQLQEVSAGSFDIDIDGATENITGIDSRTVTDLDDMVALLNAELSGGVASVNADNQIIITSSTTGATSLITVLTAAATGTFIGAILGLSAGTGAVATQGAAAGTEAIETKVAAVTAVLAEVSFRGLVFIDNPSDADAQLLSTWAQANSVLIYDVFSNSDNLVTNVTNPVWLIKLASETNYRMLYRKDASRLFATAYMSRAHTVNFTAENSAITMNLKTIVGIASEEFTQTEIDGALNVGLDIYTSIKDVPGVLCSGANDFQDNRYNLLGFIDAVSTDLYNVLKTTGTKIAQTILGVNKLIDQGERTTRGFVKAGVFAPGTWTLAETFGNVDTFNNAIETQGFYWLAGLLADQPIADRQNRISPPLQCAVKNAGAIHSVDVIINFNF